MAAFTIITGGTGDIGAQLVRLMLTKEHPFKTIVRSKQGLNAYLMRTGQSLKAEHYSAMKTLSDPRMESLICNSGPLYHLAAALGAKDTVIDLAVNGLTAIQLIRRVQNACTVKRCVFASSQSVYSILDRSDVQSWIRLAIEFIEGIYSRLDGVTDDFQMIELARSLLDNIQIPINVSPYAVSKLLVESYLYQRSQLKNFVVVRISSSYGAGSLSGRTVQEMIEARLKGHDINMHSETRDYIELEDLAVILYEAGIRDDVGGRYVDAASGENVSPEYIWKMITEELPEYGGTVEFTGKASLQPPQDNRWSRSVLGKSFSPFQEGLKRQIDWTRERIRLRQYLEDL